MVIFDTPSVKPILVTKIVVSEGVYKENIDFEGKNLTVRSTAPHDPAVVSATVIEGGFDGSGDYHLKSEAGRWDSNSQTWMQDEVTSPCLDAGDVDGPIGFEPFPNGGVINMGAMALQLKQANHPSVYRFARQLLQEI